MNPMHRVRALLKRIAFTALGSQLRVRARLHELRRTDARVVLNLHRVSSASRSASPALEPRLFGELLDFLQREFTLTTFADERPCSGPKSKPAAILSFDDGYKDFIEVAAPELLRRKIRCNHNVIPSCIDSGLPPLNVLAQDFIGQAPASCVRSLDIPGFDMREQAGLAGRLSSFLKNRPMSEQLRLRDHLLPQFMSCDDFRPTPMMNLQEVRQISDHHELGAHSFSHASMQFESTQFFADDIRRCRDYFRDRLSLHMNIYAFPNGSHGPGQVEMLLDAGVQHVLLVDEAFDGQDPTHRRFTFHAGSASEMRFRATGGLRRIPC